MPGFGPNHSVMMGLLFVGCAAPSLDSSERPASHPDASTDVASSPVDSNVPVACEPIGDLSARLESTILETSVANAWQTYTAPLVIGVSKSGLGWIGWPGADGRARLTPIDGSMRRTGDDVILPYKAVYALVAHEDGSVGALVAKMEGPLLRADQHVGFHPAWPPSAYVVRVGRDGNVQMTAHLRGGKGFDPDPTDPEDVKEGGVTWFLPTGKASLVWDGRHYGAYFLIIRHFFKGGGVHQADEYVEVDSEGREVVRHTWMGSHTFFANEAVSPSGHKMGVSVVHPKRPHLGVVLHDWAVPDQRKLQVAWPRSSELEAVDAHGFPATIGSFFRHDSSLFVSVATYVTDDASTWDVHAWYPRLVRLDESGALVDSHVLSESPIATPRDHTSPYVFFYAAPFGANQVLTVWSDFGRPGTTPSLYDTRDCTVGVFRTDGTMVAAPRVFDRPVAYDMHLGALGTGDVAWVFTDLPARKTLRIYRWRAPVCRT